MTDIQDKLNESIPPHCISERSGLSYVTGGYIKERMNEVFGWDGWGYHIVSERLISLDELAVRWFSHVKVQIVAEGMIVERHGMAVGHGNLVDKYGKAFSLGRQSEIIDFAAAESVTDAFKRAAVSLGNSMGLQLYPKSQNAPAEKKDLIAEIPVIKDFANAIAESATLDVLKFVGEQIRDSDLSASGKGGLSELFKAKKKELET